MISLFHHLKDFLKIIFLPFFRPPSLRAAKRLLKIRVYDMTQSVSQTVSSQFNWDFFECGTRMSRGCLNIWIRQGFHSNNNISTPSYLVYSSKPLREGILILNFFIKIIKLYICDFKLNFYSFRYCFHPCNPFLAAKSKFIIFKFKVHKPLDISLEY